MNKWFADTCRGEAKSGEMSIERCTKLAATVNVKVLCGGEGEGESEGEIESEGEMWV